MKEWTLVLTLCDIYYKKRTGGKIALLTSAQNMQQAPRGEYPSLPHQQQLKEAVKIHSHLGSLRNSGGGAGGAGLGGRGRGAGCSGWAGEGLPDTETWALSLQKQTQNWDCGGRGGARCMEGTWVTACTVIIIPRAAMY